MRALSWIIVASTVVTGCIIEPPDMVKDGGGDDASTPTPSMDGGGGGIPIPLPDGGLSWDGGWNGGGGDGGGGGGGGGNDGGMPDAGPPPSSTFPGSGQNGDRGTNVLWLVRVDRGTANMADTYASLVQRMTQQLAAKGFDVRMTAIGSLYEPRLYWAAPGKELSSPEIQLALEKAANANGATIPAVCSTQALGQLGGRLSQALVQPADGSTPSQGWPFTQPASALLVITLDHGARPVRYGASDCGAGSAETASWFGGGHEATRWLNTASGAWNLPRSQTRFLFISTPENETYAQMRERCAALSGFPRKGLDAASPSSIAYYDPFAEALNRHQSGLATRRDLCEAVGKDWDGYAGGFATSWARLLSLPESQR
ncbi:hypothetical protein [Archangium primigenium]|uniref:hypothetical protein n=1 Tax=[Archangium] primigenium TaxID=2792470 RepID=UPI0019598D2F|nr:hypothetical protein [Archangium primigenium]MBM7113411.1 hypothetical protein [Archangium primigenium]